MPSVVIPIEALAFQAKRDRAALAMENAALSRQVVELGGEPVFKSSEEWVALYERCMAVVQAASTLVGFLGTSKEMLEDWVALYERCMAVVRAAEALVADLGSGREMLDDWT